MSVQWEYTEQLKIVKIVYFLLCIFYTEREREGKEGRKELKWWIDRA